ncbi:carboxypeptidase-like regulatory domain-containing protein [Pedobacter metabolipauper]|uniref:Carboxypeptidase regulatory-like domain-containing protein n=1 Tax=Pedobacter metabolipauper TaxID=425513 RepID=A0A4R6SVA9_9SPHI|nr:carboxypeptidase-like regulatory domain-containing protein [Pedobacter metabolipauper]TDQ07697.1 hypothetical protein ATK78_3825 [Pedobacter metabolipauper]
MRFLNFAIALLILSIAIQITAYGQQDSIVLDNIIKKSKRLTDEHPVEKVYLHLDKPYYSVADTIWFKTYLTMEQNLPSMLSKIVYVDVLNSRDSLVQRIMLPAVNSMANGNIPLTPGTYKQDNYHIRAYTQWMMNFGEEYFFHKNVPIGEAIDKQLITNFSFKNNQTEKSQVIDAVVQFKNTDNIVQANKAVTWSVTSNGDEVSKGKGVTDQNGFLKIKIDSRKGDPITNGELNTVITLTPENILPATFSFKPKKNDNDLQFFPEAGEMIAGLPIRIAFKAINSAGLGVDVKGTITDNAGGKITDLASSHLGMGSFYLSPETGKTYKANVTFGDGSTKSYDLPAPVASGITLQVNNTDPAIINLKIAANQSFFDVNKDKTVFILGTHEGIVFYAAKTRLSNLITSAKIPKDKFPSGIIQITLFSDAGEPISERLAFNMPKPTLSLSAKTDLAAYKKRQKVKMTVTSADGPTALEGSYSISVTDDQKVPVNEDSEITILSSLLLTADLKGYVEKPNYYFNKTDAKKLASLDDLLLTQGFRRFNYKDIIAGKLPSSTLFPEQDMRITGTLRDRTGMPVKKGALRLTVTGTRIGAETLTTNSGVFTFPNLTIPDSSEVVINAKYSANGSSLMIIPDVPPTLASTKNIFPGDEILNIDSALAPYLSNSKKQYSYLRTLKEVKIEGTKVARPSHKDHPGLSTLSSITGRLIEGDRFKGCNNLAICLQSMASGLTYFENKFYVSRDYNQNKKVPVQIFLNGNPIDYFDLVSIPASNVESVEVFTRDELGTIDRLYNTNGVLVVNTKAEVKGTKISMDELRKLIPEANLLKFKPKGFSKEREFYAPKYVNAASTYNFNDLRSTIYWNPNVTTTAAPLSLEYYNGDGNGTYRVVIEGIDKNGNVSRSVSHYTVK